MPEHRFHTPLPLTLDVSVPSGEVRVETVDGEEAVVVVDGDERLVEQTRVELDGDRLVVSLRCRMPFGLALAIGDLSLGGRRLSIHASVPHGAAARFATASADLRAEGRLASLEARTASGDLLVHGEIEGRATVKTVSGDVQLERVGGDLRARTVSGDLDAGPIGGSVEAKSVSGNIRLASLRSGRASFTSVSGDVEIGIARGSFLDVDAGSVSGDLSSEVPLGSEPSALDGEGPTVVLRGKTVSGDVTVFRAA